MSRQSIIEQVEHYGQRYPLEKETVQRFISFVREYENCCERSLDIGHVTGSAWVVNKTGSHVLLTHHKKLNRWLQLGGHADGDANILRVAFREVEEESGLTDLTPWGDGVFDLDIHSIPERKDETEHFHFDMRFAMQVSGSEEYSVSEESHDLEWVEIERIQDYTQEASMLRMASKWIERSCHG